MSSSALFGLLRLFFTLIPWIIIAVFALLSLIRKKNLATLLEFLGAAILVTTPVVNIIIPYILPTIFSGGSTYALISAVYLLTFVPGITLFTVGYCLNKRRPPAPAAGFPIQA